MDIASIPTLVISMSCYAGYFGKLKPCYYEGPFTHENKPPLEEDDYVNVKGYFTYQTTPYREVYSGDYRDCSHWNDYRKMSEMVSDCVVLPWNLWDLIIVRLDWEQAKDVLSALKVEFIHYGHIRFEDHPEFQDRNAKYAYIILDMG